MFLVTTQLAAGELSVCARYNLSTFGVLYTRACVHVYIVYVRASVLVLCFYTIRRRGALAHRM